MPSLVFYQRATNRHEVSIILTYGYTHRNISHTTRNKSKPRFYKYQINMQITFGNRKRNRREIEAINFTVITDTRYGTRSVTFPK